MRDMSLKLKRTVLDNNWNELKCELIILSRYCSLPGNGHQMLAEEYKNLEVPNTKQNPGVDPPHGSGCIFGSSIMFHLVG